MKKSTLSLDLLRRILHYDPLTGVFTWMQPVSRRLAIGEVAGAIASNGRRYIGVMGEKHSAHRLAWFYHHGVWPTGNVKQKNGDYDDARIDNLVEESAAETAQRGAVRVTNTSGVQGVSWSSAKRKWLATITRDYKRVHLGYFTTVEDAESAYLAAKNVMPEDKGTEVPNAEAIADRRRLRAAWKALLRLNDGKTGWSSFDVFRVEVGSILHGYELRPIEETQLIGPGNFQWIERDAAAITRKPKSGYWRGHDLQRKFGIDLAEYQRMFVAQGGVCAICKQPEISERNGRAKWLAVDHDHATGIVRELLCSNCNPMLGYAKDDPALLRAAADYLDSHAVSSNVLPLKKEA